MELQDKWISNFETSLQKYLQSIGVKMRSVLEYFNTQPIDRTLEFLQKFHQVFISSHTLMVNALCISPDETLLATGSKDHSLRLWTMGKLKQCSSIENLGCEVNSIKFTHDGQRILCGCNNSTIQVLNLKPLVVIYVFKGQNGVIRELCIIPNLTRFISVSSDISLVIWNYSNYKCEAFLKKHEKPLTCIAVSPCGKLAVSGSYDKKIVLWDLCCLKSLKVSKEFANVINSVEFTPNSRAVIFTSANSIFVYSFENSAEQKIDGHTYHVVKALHLGSMNRIVSASYDKTVRLWSSEDFSQIWSISLAPCYSPNFVLDRKNNKIVLGLNKGQVRVLDLLDTNSQFCAPGHNKVIFLLRLSFDFKTLASTSCDHVLMLWDLPTGNMIGCMKKDHSINCMDFSLSDDYLAAGFENGFIEIWKLREFQSHRVFEMAFSQITSVKFLDKSHLVSSSNPYNSNSCKFDIWDVEEERNNRFLFTSDIFCVKISVFKGKYFICQFKKTKNSLISLIRIKESIRRV